MNVKCSAAATPASLSPLTDTDIPAGSVWDWFFWSMDGQFLLHRVFLNGSSWAQVNQVQTQWLCSSLRACTYVHRWCLFQTRWVRTGTLWQRCPAARSRRCRWSHKWHRSCLRHYRTSCTRCRRHAEGCSGALHRERHVRHVRQQGEINRRWG